MFIRLIFHNSKANRFYLNLFSYSDSWMLLSTITGFLMRRQFFFFLLVYAYYMDFLHEGALWLPVWMNTLPLFIAQNNAYCINVISILNHSKNIWFQAFISMYKHTNMIVQSGQKNKWMTYNILDIRYVYTHTHTHTYILRLSKD